MKKKLLFFLPLLSIGMLCAQVNIGSTAQPKSFSALEIQGQNSAGDFGGLRLPQLSTTDRDALTDLSDPAAKGLTIYNTTTEYAEYWDGVKWVPMRGRAGSDNNGEGGCLKCGAYIAPGVWREFMCHNLGADYTADPFTPSMEIIGAYYPWGSIYPCGVIPCNPSATTVSGYGWATDKGNDLAYDKRPQDPCPAGYRVPNVKELQGLINNNPLTVVGDGSEGSLSGMMIGDALFLPAAGINSTHGPYNFGTFGMYWSNKYDEEYVGYPYIYISIYYMLQVAVWYSGSPGGNISSSEFINFCSVRCIAQ